MENKMVEHTRRWAEHSKKIDEYHEEFMAAVAKIKDPECARALVALSCFTETCFMRDSESKQVELELLGSLQKQVESHIKHGSENTQASES